MEIKSFLEYLQYEKNYSEHTRRAYGRDIAQFESFLQQEHPQVDLVHSTYSSIRHWIAHLAATHTNRSINRKLSSLKTFYGYLERVGQRKGNPLGAHRSLKVQSDFALPLSEKEMEEFLDAMRFEDTVPGRRDQLMIELLYSTGMRRKELIGLRLADWDRSKRILRIQGKGNKERFLPVLPEIQEMLKAYLEDMPLEADRSPQAPLLRTDKGKPLYPTFVYRTINKYLQEVSTKVKKSPHILRHTFATHLLNRGADLNSVKELLGHASLASTQVYTHSSIEELKKVHQAAHPRSEKK